MVGFLPDPYVPDVGQMISGALSGYKMGDAMRQQGLLRAAGEKAAAGDMSGAKATLYGGGDFTTAQGMETHAAKMREMANTATDAQLARALKVQSAFADMAATIETPEQFDAAKATLSKAGIPVGQYTYADLPALKAQTMDMKTRIQLELNARQQGVPLDLGSKTGAAGTPGEVPPEIALRASAIREGREPMPTSVRQDPMFMSLQREVLSQDPEYSSNRFKYRTDWQAPNSRVGTQRIANNTAIAHAAGLSDMVDKYLPDHTTALQNKVSNWWTQNTPGIQGAGWLNEWNTYAQMVAGELAKTAGDLTGEERNKWLERFNPANGKEAVHRALSAATEILAGKTNAQAGDWKKVMGKNVPVMDAVDPENTGVVEHLQKMAERYKGPKTMQAVKSLGDSTSGTVDLRQDTKGKAYAKLPSGTRFIAPDGTERIKP